MKEKRYRLRGVIVLLTLALLLGGCTVMPSIDEADAPSVPRHTEEMDKAQEEDTASAPSETDDPTSAENANGENTTGENTNAEDAVRAQLTQMSLHEKVGQLFLVRFDALDPNQTAEQINDSSAEGVTELTAEVERMLEVYPVGGIVLFGKNIETPTQLTTLLRALQDASAVPLLLAVDEEGGAVARLANHAGFDLPRYESAAAVGASGDPADAYAMGQTIGAYLHQYGFNMDFAPVADVNTNPNNPIIGSRAFSSNGETAAAMAKAMAEGLKQEGVIPTFKHFPGHGDTAEDSHSGLAINRKTKEELAQCEWLPYESLTEQDCVMVGHIAVPEITGDQTPASLSYELVTEILRGELGFSGVVVTDSLSMQAITQEYDAGEAAVAALLAGCDVLLMPEDLGTAFEAVVTAVEEGRIREERLDESVYRILTLKASLPTE